MIKRCGGVQGQGATSGGRGSRCLCRCAWGWASPAAPAAAGGCCCWLCWLGCCCAGIWGMPERPGGAAAAAEAVAGAAGLRTAGQITSSTGPPT